ncbi:response regulator [Candidatus Nitrospira allomarina]|uniref:Response regulator n=1 Tax=Candidatus Nitrospira allomarina TaxID=3020900 RepID=A0AA96GAC4_9BACT|nr:response regulator [Candidatus Nitrospira allomarina]WNM56500.1 response regulator [Candidatus Nitrospira allomarina]
MEQTVLIIEDDESISKALEVRLQSRGFRVTIAFDAIMGMQKAAELLPQAILLDITLPGGNGLSLAERLKNSDRTQKIPIIFLTASKQADLRRSAIAVGGAALFEKPYDFEYLLAALRAVIQHPTVRLAI